MRSITATAVFSAIALSRLLEPTLAAVGITLFTGQTCTGVATADFPCDGNCHEIDGLQSFHVDRGSGPHCVTIYVEGGCVTNSQKFTHTGQDGQCTNIVEGTLFSSVRCAPNNLCVE